MNHTPGPWAHYWRDDLGKFRIGPDDGRSMPVASTVNQGNRANEEANARLIAAAPDLLAAAELSVWEFDNEGQVFRDAVGGLREAIAKAKGA